MFSLVPRHVMRYNNDVIAQNNAILFKERIGTMEQDIKIETQEVNHPDSKTFNQYTIVRLAYIRYYGDNISDRTIKISSEEFNENYEILQPIKKTHKSDIKSKKRRKSNNKETKNNTTSQSNYKSAEEEILSPEEIKIRDEALLKTKEISSYVVIHKKDKAFQQTPMRYLAIRNFKNYALIPLVNFEGYYPTIYDEETESGNSNTEDGNKKTKYDCDIKLNPDTSIFFANNLSHNVRLITNEISALRDYQLSINEDSTSDELDKFGIEFDTFEKRYWRHIEKVLVDIIGAKNYNKFFKKDKTYNFTFDDVSSFDYIYETYDSIGSNFIKENYSEVSEEYLSFLYNEILRLKKAYDLDIDMTTINIRFNKIQLIVVKSRLKKNLSKLSDIIDWELNIPENDHFVTKIKFINESNQKIVDCANSIIDAANKIFT